MAERPSLPVLVLSLAAFLVLGGPAAYFLWHELSDLLYGRVADVRFGVLLGALAVFALLVWALAAYVRRLAGPRWREGNP